MHLSRTALTVAASAALGLAGLAPAVAAGSGGVTGPAFYVDGMQYRTVATPTDLSHTGAPAHSFDAIYDLGGAQSNIAEAKPGDPDFNGGRWMVHAVAFPNGYDAAVAAGDVNGNGVLDSDAELMAAFGAGAAVDNGVVAKFVCPVIKL